MCTMTISESNSVFTNKIQTNNEYQATNAAFPAINELTDLGESFSNIFTEALNSNASKSKQETETIVSKDENIDLIKNNLFSALGLGALPNSTEQGTLDLLTNQSSIDTMQASMFLALQSSLFSAPQTTEMTTNNENKVASAYDPEGVNESIVNSLVQFSFGEDGIDLKDGFDIFNVMQHIPILSSVYQDVSGQDISVVSKLSGGYLYGGVFGLAYSMLDLAIESYSGRSLNDMVANYDYSSIFNNEVSGESKVSSDESSQVSYSPFR